MITWRCIDGVVDDSARLGVNNVLSCAVSDKKIQKKYEKVLNL